PRYVNTIFADKTIGCVGAYAVAMALYERERSGRGQAIEVPMFETMVSFTLIEHLAGETFCPASEIGRASCRGRDGTELGGGARGIRVWAVTGVQTCALPIPAIRQHYLRRQDHRLRRRLRGRHGALRARAFGARPGD